MRRTAVLIVIALAVTGCGGGDDAGDTTTTTAVSTTTTAGSTTTTTGATTTTVTTIPVTVDARTLFFFLDSLEPDGPFLAAVAPGRPGCCDDELISTLDALLVGPTDDQQLLGVSSAVPAGTVLLGVELDDGVLTVNLSREFTSGGGSSAMEGRVAQVTWTATAFDGIDGVRFAIEGTVADYLGGEGIDVSQPRTRDNTLSMLPEILIEQPAFGETVQVPFDLTGMARVFEGAFLYAVVDGDGLIVLEDFTMARQPDVGIHGPYDVTLAPDVEGPGTIVVWEESARDGSRINIVEYPVTFVSG